MNKLDKQILKIIKDNTITESVTTVSNHIEQENSFEVLCNHDFVISKVKQSISNALVDKMPKKVRVIVGEDTAINYWNMGHNNAIDDIESVIKEILGGNK